MAQLHFYFDQSRCTGCGACAVACKDWNHVPAGAGTQWRRVYSTEAGRFPRVDVVHLCVSCYHCAEPACAKACPSGAIQKRPGDGVVLVDREVCQGCRACQTACPYGAPQYAPGDHRMMKCTFCTDRLAGNLKPACVDACPYRALDAGTETELRAKYPHAAPLSAGSIPGIGAEHEATRPSVLIKPRPARADVDAPQTMRRNGVVVTHLRAVPGPDDATWRQAAATPFANKVPKKGC